MSAPSHATLDSNQNSLPELPDLEHQRLGSVEEYSNGHSNNQNTGIAAGKSSTHKNGSPSRSHHSDSKANSHADGHTNNYSTTTPYTKHDPADNDDDDDEDDEDDMFEQLLPPKPESHDNIDEDLDELLGIELSTMNKNDTLDKNKERKKTASLSTPQNKCCVRKFGNTIILHTSCFNKTRYGLIGPHYFGVIFTTGLLLGASLYFTDKAFHDVGTKSGFVCVVLTIMSFYNLLRTVCVDPGIVKKEDQIVKRIKKHDSDEEDGQVKDGEEEWETIMIGDEKGWRYCGVCSLYQPPRAAHCPNCNVCIEEYDHHCPWMGTCIGKKNMSSFVCFNMTWLIFLIYACLWVIALGPLSAKQKH
jgi:hypothetical protein